MPLGKEELDKIFCMTARKYGLKRNLLKAIAIQESSLNVRAYRFEQGFWNRYLKDNPEWKDKEPSEVSASYGICQLMYVVAYELGWRGEVEDLYNPVINVELCARKIVQLRDRFYARKFDEKFPWLNWEESVCSAYNGGAGGNPNSKGVLRTKLYAFKVMRRMYELARKEEDCRESNS